MEFVLESKNISKSYGKHQALKDINISVPKGVVYGLLGPNGAGKSTFIRLVNRILMPDSGSIFVNGELLNDNHVMNIGYLPEERGLYKKMKVGEQLVYLAQLRGMTLNDAKQRAKKKLKDFDALAWWGKKVEELSKGMQQKVQFIATTMHEPDLLILDEPFSGFDPLNADLIKTEILKLKENGSSIILSTHRMESVEELCEYISLIHQSTVRLSGKTIDIKEEFKKHVFSVKFNGDLLENELFEIMEVRENAHSKTARITVKSAISNKQLIQTIIHQVELLEFNEELPSINQIFIQSVQEGAK